MQAGADATLIEASRRGDREAFAQIIERYQRAVYAVAFSGVRDRALADDVTQDTFVIAWRTLDELRDERRLPAWLCGIARNRARELRRKTHRETLVEIDDVAHTTTPFDVLTEAETERIVAAALGQVPEVYREPLVLYYYEERSIDDVARSLGISLATTNKRLSRGRQCLAERVATVERGLTRRGPSPGLAASVLAVIGVAASASHVDASPAAVKGSTMHKLAIAAIVTATVGAAGGVFVATTRSDAHAAKTQPSHDTMRHAHAAKSTDRGTLCDVMIASAKRQAPSLASLVDGSSAATEGNDCASVGRHLQELEADTTHGPDSRPDDAFCEKCTQYYTTLCESQAWSVERRNCTLAAADLINAHLCAGTVPTRDPDAAIPANLTCVAIAPHIAGIVQGAGMHADVTDMPQQIEAACEVGQWTVELRTCLSNGTTIDALQACILPDGEPH